MPRSLQSTDAARREHARVVAFAETRKRENAKMRKRTEAVATSPVLPGNRTDGGEGKARKPNDRLSRHVNDLSAHALGDVVHYSHGVPMRIERGRGMPLVRVNGLVDVQATMALQARIRVQRAATRKEG